ncbi:starch-binding protein [Wenyingzhuangia marina]|nr:starch-binding protein [Wenyingzhuangia marina]
MQILTNNYKIMKHKILYYLILGFFFTACDIDPLPIQDQTTEELWSHSTTGEGILTNAYTNLNTGYPIFMDYYTDNAVPSTPGDNQLALGSWTVESSPIGNWNNNYTTIKYLNLFIENGTDLVYGVSDKQRDSILKSNRVGEAYFLRAWYQSELLKNYAGKAEGTSEVLGFPIVTTVLKQDDNLDLPRNTYEECVAQIANDCDKAIELLPIKYDGGTDVYTGIINRGRASGLAAMALKARVYLSAASPAYGDATKALWERAATAAYEAIEASGGLVDLDNYNNFNDIQSFDNIWVEPEYSANGFERTYYPPSLFGAGVCNPSQNLVNEFPTLDGYPIDNTTSMYDSDQPYSNRDNRFYRFIFFNDDNYNGTTIETFVGGNDASGGLNQQGTRTGYFMKKLTSKNVNLEIGQNTTDSKFYVYLGKTELYLNFAEAANEAYGPNGTEFSFSAADVMAKIRMRAGIDSDPITAEMQDQYMDDQVLAGKDAFRDFIKSNRRIELCFEGFRFWDIRRWNESLNHTIRGVEITRGTNGDEYDYFDVENHTFSDYMRYAPVPFSQTLIMNNLKQNAGW